MAKKIKMSFKFKLIALFLLVGLVPLFTVSVLSYYNAKGNIEDEVFKSLTMYRALTTEGLQDFFNEKASQAKVLATTEDVYQSLNRLRNNSWDTNGSQWQQDVEELNNLTKVLDGEFNFSLVYISDPQGRAVYSNIASLIGFDFSNRDYIRGSLAGQTYWSNLFYSDVINENCIVVSVPIRSQGETGEIIGTLNLAIEEGEISHRIHNGLRQLGQSADAYLVDANGLLYTNTLLGTFQQGAALKERINTRAIEVLAPAIRAGNFNFSAQDVYPDYLGNSVLGSLSVMALGQTPMGLIIEIDEYEAFGGVISLRNTMGIVAMVALVAIAILSYIVALGVVRPVSQVGNVVGKLAQGDFTERVQVSSSDEIGEMASGLNNTINSLSETISKVREASILVANGSEEISLGNQDLSQRTEEQASSLEEISSTVEEITASLEASSANALEANRISLATMDNVKNGEVVVKDMQQAMVDITQGSEEIAEIISKVNDIAFQTNLLALNAAVEAARAGEQGRGFAVVAAEVRNLAGRSAESAKEIEKLIKDSIIRVERGNKLMNDTDRVLKEIVLNTQRTTDVIGEIAASLKEQSIGANDIRAAIEELNQVTQQNASLVEEIASSSENMSGEAVQLEELLSFFKIGGVQTKAVAKDTPKRVAPLKPKKKHSQARQQVAATNEEYFDFNEDDFEKF